MNFSSTSTQKTIKNPATLCGLFLFLAAIQFFIVQAVVESSFVPRYSNTKNTISDLGNTVCGVFNSRYVCSPDHPFMNTSFIVLGVTMAIGSWLLMRKRKEKRNVTVGFSMFAIGGLGAVLVGLYPENTVPLFHGLGTAAPFLLGNIGLILLGISWPRPKLLRFYTVCTGTVALAALVSYASRHDLGIGEGGMERLVAYPQVIWMIVIGVYGLIRVALSRKPSAVSKT